MTALNLTFAAPGDVSLTGSGTLAISFPAPPAMELAAVGIQGPASPGGGVSDGDKGGIVVSGSGAIWTVKDGSITDLMLSASATALFAAASHTHSIAHITGLQAALDGKQAALGFTPENAAQKGVAGGYAGLDGTGKVPAAQLPAYVDDVVEAANFAALPGTGETGKIYVTLDTNKTLRWSGSAYVEISPSPGSTDSVTEGSVNLYFTAARARATDLTGYAAAGSRIALVAGDTFIGAMGKLGRWVADLGQAAFAAASTAGLNMLTAANAAAQTALLDTFTSGAKGLAPASGGGTTNFLRADGTWAAPAGGGGGSGDVVGPASATDNALVRFDATTGKLVQNSVVTLSDAGALTVPNSALPSAPASGNVTIFALDLNGKSLPAFIDPEGFMTTVQADLGEFNVARFMPQANTTTAADAGVPLTNTGTFAAAAIATTNFFTMKRRLLCQVTVAATTAVAGVRGSQNAVRIGRTAGAPGGFSSRIVWGPSTGVSTATTRAFCGFRATAAPTDVNPSSLLNLVGMGWDSGDTNVQMMTNDGAGTATKTDLGASFPRPNTNNTTVYELQLYSPNSTTQSVNWRVIRYDTTGKTIAAEATGTITTDLPANTVLMAPHVWMSVGGTSSVIGVACMGITIVNWY